MATPPPKPSAPVPLEERYPAIEKFVQGASPSDIPDLFQPLRSDLAALKGARGDQGKKVEIALDRAEELLQLLLKTRGKLEASGKKRR